MTKKGYYDQRMATSKALKRSVKRTSSWSTICKSLCTGESQNKWEMDHLSDLQVSNKETEPKIRNLCKKLIKIRLLKFLLPLVKSNLKVEVNGQNQP